MMQQQTNAPQNQETAVSRRRRQRRERRKRLETRISTISVLLILLTFGFFTIYMTSGTRATVSLVEKRNLTKFPEFSLKNYFSGEFTAGVTKWFDDTVPNRDDLKNAGISVKSLFGFRGSSDVAFVNKPKPVAKPTEAEPTEEPQASESVASTDGTTPTHSTEPTQPETTEPTQRDFTGEEAEGEWENGLLIVNQDGHWRCMELFGGGSGTTYAEALNTLQEKVGDHVTIYSMPAPLASEFYVPSNYAEYSASQSDCFDNVHKKLNSGIVALNICSVLAKHTEEPIYCRTDHHWMPLGAYYAAESFCKAAGVPFADLTKYTQDKNEGFVGTMYAFSGDSRIHDDPEDFVFYRPTATYQTYFYDTAFNFLRTGDLIIDTDSSNSYLMFMGGDDYTVKINTNVKNGRKLLLIKDSYGNAEVPFYTSSFEQIFVMDVRYFERNLVNFINDMGITDVLFSMCSYSVVGTNADYLPDLLTQDADSSIVDEQTSSQISNP